MQQCVLPTVGLLSSFLLRYRKLAGIQLDPKAEHTFLSGLRPHQLTSFVLVPAALRAGAEMLKMQLLHIKIPARPAAS